MSKVTLEASFASEVAMDAKMQGSAWQNAVTYPLELVNVKNENWTEEKIKNVGSTLHEKGNVRLLWNREALYVGVAMEDSDVFNDGTADQTHLYTMGDTIEVFVKPENQNYYWELYGTPNRLRTVFFYPGRGRLFVPSVTHCSVDITIDVWIDGTLNDWQKRDRGWNLLMKIPASMLEKYGCPFTNDGNWTVFVARQNYSAYLPLKELSSCPFLPKPDFHLYENYARLKLNDPR